MVSDKYVQTLAAYGDPLERVIVLSHASLHQVVYPYAAIWVDHIEPRRLKDNPSKVVPEWMDFAGSHYTAMIRVFQASQKLDAMKRLLGALADGNDSALALIELHDLTAGFWEHIGACIDNLSACWSDAPVLRVAKPKENIVAPDGSRLDWMYDRRSQFIHSRIVPKNILEGATFFNVRLFDNKRTDWSSEYRREELVEDTYPDLWMEFLDLISTEWQKLRARLRDRDPDRPVSQLTVQYAVDLDEINPEDIRVTSNPGKNSVLWNLPTVPPSGTQ